MKKKPILFISPLPPPYGGIASWTQTLMQHGLPDGTPIVLIDVRIRGKRNIFDKAKLSMTEILRALHILCLYLYRLIFTRPQIIHLNCSLSPLGVMRDLVCVILARLFALPVITHYHANLSDFKYNHFFGLSGQVLIKLLEFSTINIVINQASLNKAKGFTKKANPIFLLANFIDDKLFDLKSDGNHAGYEIENHPLQAIYVGGVTINKGCREIFAAAKNFPDIEFHLYGKIHDDILPFIMAKSSNIILHDSQAHPTVLLALAKADFLIFPSYSEGFPLTILESMALGLPIIATSVGAIPEIVEAEQGGILIKPQQQEELFYAISRLVENKFLRFSMGTYNRQKCFQQYRYSAVIHQLLHIYQHSIGPKKCAG